MRQVRTFFREDGGGATAEYALILAIVGLAIAGALAKLNGKAPSAAGAAPAPAAQPPR